MRRLLGNGPPIRGGEAHARHSPLHWHLYLPLPLAHSLVHWSFSSLPPLKAKLLWWGGFEGTATVEVRGWERVKLSKVIRDLIWCTFHFPDSNSVLAKFTYKTTKTFQVRPQRLSNWGVSQAPQQFSRLGKGCYLGR